MRIRTTLVPLACIALIATACAKNTPAASPTAGAAMSETTISGCVISQGTVAPAKATGSSFATLKKGVIAVGSDTAYPPFESVEGGKVVGFDVDLLGAMAKKMGSPNVEFHTAAFDTIFTALAAGKFDVVMSAVTIKAARKTTVDFTDPYFKSDQSLAVSDANAGTIKGTDDLSGKIVGVQSGTTGEDCAKNALKAKGKVKDVRSYDTGPDAFTDLAAGRVDAVIVDLPTAKQIVANRTGSRVVQIIRTKEEYGIAVAKTNPNLREALNRALQAVKDDGTYRRLFLKWLKTEPPA